MIDAHGLGGAQDLPIPLTLAVAGAVAALVVSFTVLAIAWRSPRYDSATSGRPAPRLAAVTASPWFTGALRTFGMLVFGYTVAAAAFGENTILNPFFGVVYVWIWVGMIFPLSLLLGPVWKAISPVRTLHLLLSRATGGDRRVGIATYPERLGYWPAALGLYAFVWLELVFPYSTELGPARLWFAIYVAVMLVGGAVFGDRFFERADPFEVYSTLIAHLSPWGRRTAPDEPWGDDGGELVVRSPLANLDSIPVSPGLVGVVGVLFGSTAYDSFHSSTEWIRFIQGASLTANTLNNLGLLVFCLGAIAIFSVGCMLTGVGPELRRRALPDLFAHSIVPIVLGYVIAHYLTYLVDTGTITLVNAADPFGTGANLFGLANLSPTYYFAYHPTLLAFIKVGAVVLGHVVGVVAAHDRAVRLLPPRHQLTGQLALLVAMVVFTAGGLLLLFAA